MTSFANAQLSLFNYLLAISSPFAQHVKLKFLLESNSSSLDLISDVNTGNLAYPCTGSIISKRVILTAAHCALAKADSHRLSSVRIGEFDTGKDPDCAETGFCAPSAINHAVSHVVVHPDYASGLYHHDIALLILRTPINYTVAAQPVCLQRDRTNLVVGKRAIIVGWGKVSLSSIRSSEMQYMDVPLASWDQCLRVYGSSGALDSQKSIGESLKCKFERKFSFFLHRGSMDVRWRRRS